MIFFSKTIKNTKYAWELNLFYKLREWKDGITFFELDCSLDKYIGDHTPRFDFHLILLNYTIVEFNIYNIYHQDDPEYYS